MDCILHGFGHLRFALHYAARYRPVAPKLQLEKNRILFIGRDFDSTFSDALLMVISTISVFGWSWLGLKILWGKYGKRLV